MTTKKAHFYRKKKIEKKKTTKTYQHGLGLVLAGLVIKLSGLDDLGVHVQLELSLHEHLLFHRVHRQETEHADFLGLTDTVRTILRLQILVRIPGFTDQKEEKKKGSDTATKKKQKKKKKKKEEKKKTDVPVRVEDDDGVGGLKVETKTSRTRTEQENENVFRPVVELLNQLLTALGLHIEKREYFVCE
jgi:hypothetical protein